MHTCTECNLDFFTKTELCQHMLKYHENAFECNKCGKMFKTFGHLQNHLLAHEKYTCNKCGNVFPTERGYNNHIKKCVYNKNSNLRCKICGKCYNTETTLKSHYKHCHPIEYTQIKHDNLYQKLTNKNVKIVNCPICNTLRDERGLSCHIRLSHPTYYDEYVKTKLDKIEQQHIKDSDLITCPICKQKFKVITRHMIKKHNMSLLDISKIITTRKQSYRTYKEYTCEICNKKCRSKAGLIQHCKNNDNDHISYLEKIKTKCNNNGYYTCAICNKHTNQIKQHVVDKHKIIWENYCKQYQHDINDTIFFSNSHRAKLSAAAIKVYKKLYENTNLKYNTAYSFLFSFDNKKYIARSFEEFKIIYTLLYYNKQFQYETDIITYYLKDIEHHYILDLKYNNDFIEIKGTSKLEKFYNEEKYKIISDILFNKFRKKLLILNYELFVKKYNLPYNKNDFFLKIINEKLNNNTLKVSKYGFPTLLYNAGIDINHKNIKWRNLKNDLEKNNICCN